MKDTILIILGVLISWVALVNWGIEQKNEKERMTQNLFSKTKEFTTKYGEYAKETTELRYTIGELKKVYKADSSQLSVSQKQLKKAAEEIENMGIKLKDADTYISNLLESKPDTFIVDLPSSADSLVSNIKPIKSKHWDISFSIENNKLKVLPKYKCEITTIIDRRADYYTLKGHKRFFLASLINPRYQYLATTKVDDKDAKITNTVYIKFQKEKGESR